MVITGQEVIEASDRDAAVTVARRDPALCEGARLGVHEVAARRTESPRRSDVTVVVDATPRPRWRRPV